MGDSCGLPGSWSEADTSWQHRSVSVIRSASAKDPFTLSSESDEYPTSNIQRPTLNEGVIKRLVVNALIIVFSPELPCEMDAALAGGAGFIVTPEVAGAGR